MTQQRAQWPIGPHATMDTTAPSKRPPRLPSGTRVTRPTTGQPEGPAPPHVPASYAAELEALEKVAGYFLQQAVPARRRHALDTLGAYLTARTVKSRAAGLCDDPDLGAWALGLRLVGERLHAIGGLDLMEAVIAQLAPEDSTNSFLRRKLLRTSWHQIGDSLR